MDTDKDNFMVAFKWADTDKMMYYNRQQITFDYETDWGLKAYADRKIGGERSVW